VLLYANDLVVIAETEDGAIKRLNEWKDNVENRAMNKTKVMISGEHQKLSVFPFVYVVVFYIHT